MSKFDLSSVPMVEIVEGKARLLVPNPETYRVSRGTYSPSKAIVFFNPLMKENRDIMVAVITALSKVSRHVVTFAESMGGVGVRTVRVLLETDVEEALYNDFHLLAVKVATENLERNGVLAKARISSLDANFFHSLHGRGPYRVTYLDLDPFGSPAPYMFTAISAVQHGGILGVTSTDSAVLGGLYPTKSLARYGTWIEKTHMMKEIGIRSLLGSIARFASSQDVSIVPLLSYCDKYYVRLYVKILRSRSKAQISASKLGFVRYNEESLSWALEPTGGPLKRNAEKLIGPVWTAAYCDKEFVKTVYNLSKDWLSQRSTRLLENMLEELDSFGYVSLPAVTKKLKTSSVSRSFVMEKIRASGYKASPSIFGGDCIKTDIPPEELLRFFKTNVLS